MDQGRNVKPVNNEFAVKPKKPVLLRIFALVLLLFSAIIFLVSTLVLYDYDSQYFLGPLLLWIAGIGFFMGLLGIVIAFGLNYMKKWALYTFLVQLPVIFILGCFIFNFYFSYWFPFDLFLIIIILITMFIYLRSIRKQFN